VLPSRKWRGKAWNESETVEKSSSWKKQTKNLSLQKTRSVGKSQKDKIDLEKTKKQPQIVAGVKNR